MLLLLPHDRSEFFSTEKYWHTVEQFFCFELENDGEDITAEFYVSENISAKAFVVTKSEGVLAGVDELTFFLQKFFPEISFSWKKSQGEGIRRGEKIIEFSGNARKILKAERIFLNVLSRLSGIATQTKRNIFLTGGTVHIAATRKTQWSYLDKKAVHVAGGLTHRIGLFDAILLKENHQIIEGYKTPNLSFFSQGIKFFEIEVETTEEFFKVFNEFLEDENTVGLQKVIMLDNFMPEQIKLILDGLEKEGKGKKFRHENNIFLEASGGITEVNIAQYSNVGVDVLSMGSLTHSVLPIDFSLRIEKASEL